LHPEREGRSHKPMTHPTSGPTNSWTSYLDQFHEHNPGITQDVLTEASDVDGINAYDWLLDATPPEPDVLALDLACGSCPLHSTASHLRWVGVDRSRGELARAGQLHPRTLVLGDGQRLPFRNATFGLVTCSMALMLLNPVDTVIAEIHRVLEANGTLALLLPGSVPLTTRDRLRYLRLLTALHKLRPTYPNNVHLGRLSARLEHAGFKVVVDERRCFRYPLPDENHTRRFANSLYLPGRSDEDIERGVEATRSWIGSTIGIPLRRVVCTKVIASQ